MALPYYNKDRVARHFGRAATTYNRHNQLQQRVASELATHLRPAAVLIDAGCGPGINLDNLALQTEQYLGLDISAPMLAQARAQNPQQVFLQGDLEQLPFSAASADALFSSLAVQWCNAPQDFLSEATRIVRPGGQVLFSTVLSNSLQPLSQCLEQIDGHAHSNPQRSLRDWEKLIAGQPTMRVELIQQQRFTVFSSTLLSLLQGIRGVGANYQAGSAAPRLSRYALQQLSGLYESYRQPDGLPLHYEIGLFILSRNND